MPQWLKSANWIDAARMKRVARVAFVFSLLAVIALVLSSDGMRDLKGRPLGTDFFSFWSAGKLVLAGDAQGAYDAARHLAEHQELLAQEKPMFFPFLYPPAFLFVAAALAAIPYAWSWLLYMAAGGAAFLAVVRRIAPVPGALLLAASAPGFFLNFVHGQNGFLVAALFGGAMLCLDKRPLLSGVLIGLLALKPQYGVLIPLVLAASGRWKTFGAAAVVVTVEVLAATLAFGPGIWGAFLANAEGAREGVLESGAIGWEKMQSLFSFARAAGAPVEAAYLAQGTLMLGLAAALVVLWRSGAAFALKVSALILAAFLATPYSVDYDLVMLLPAGAFLAMHGLKEGFRPYEKFALALLWIAPLVGRPAGEFLLMPIGFIAALFLFGLVLARAAPSFRRAGLSPPSRILSAG